MPIKCMPYCSRDNTGLVKKPRTCLNTEVWEKEMGIWWPLHENTTRKFEGWESQSVLSFFLFKCLLDQTEAEAHNSPRKRMNRVGVRYVWAQLVSRPASAIPSLPPHPHRKWFLASPTAMHWRYSLFSRAMASLVGDSLTCPWLHVEGPAVLLSRMSRDPAVPTSHFTPQKNTLLGVDAVASC